MTRRTAREKALQALYQIDLIDAIPTEAIQCVLEEDKNETEVPFLKQLVTGSIENLNEIDETIRPALNKWKLERLSIIDRNILRLAVYEMKYVEDIPHNVSINEGVELAKAFGDDKSKKFVNGVLSTIKDTLN